MRKSKSLLVIGVLAVTALTPAAVALASTGQGPAAPAACTARVRPYHSINYNSSKSNTGNIVFTPPAEGWLPEGTFLLTAKPVTQPRGVTGSIKEASAGSSGIACAASYSTIAIPASLSADAMTLVPPRGGWPVHASITVKITVTWTPTGVTVTIEVSW